MLGVAMRRGLSHLLLCCTDPAGLLHVSSPFLCIRSAGSDFSASWAGAALSSCDGGRDWGNRLLVGAAVV